MTVVLTAMNRFLNEDNGLQMAFLDGNQPDRICAPMKEYIEARGGQVRTSVPVKVRKNFEMYVCMYMLYRKYVYKYIVCMYGSEQNVCMYV